MQDVPGPMGTNSPVAKHGDLRGPVAERVTNGSQRHCVYRFYDEAGGLLYVGQSCRFGERMSSHRREQDWWSQVASIKLDHCVDKEEASRLERSHIVSLGPKHNVQHSDGVVVSFPTDYEPVEDPTADRWLRAEDVADAFDVDKSTVARWIKAGVPHGRLGRSPRFKWLEVRAWLLDEQAS